MLTARDIYDTYQVPPWLALHQLRVAAVGKMAAEHQMDPVDTHLVTSACLLHDIGAIVKFDFTYAPHSSLKALCSEEDIPRWVAVQKRMRERYGDKEHAASEAIIRELGLEEVRRVFNDMGISQMKRILESGKKEVLIAQYGDMRVGPYGIVSIAERVADVSERYRDFWQSEGGEEGSKKYPAQSQELERRIFTGTDFLPADINDVSAAPLIEELWDYAVA